MTRTGSRTLSSPVCEPHRYLSTSSSHNVFSYYVFFRESVASTLQPPPVGAGMCPLVNVIATEILYLGGSSQHSTIQVRQTATTWSPNTTRECNRPHRYGAVPQACRQGARKSLPWRSQKSHQCRAISSFRVGSKVPPLL